MSNDYSSNPPVATGVRIRNGNSTLATFDPNDFRCGSLVWRPITTSAASLGDATYRFSAVFADTGAVSTSDRNLKKDINDLTDLEIEVAKKCAQLYKTFKLKNGTSNRLHVGVISQDVAQLFIDNGLDPSNYGLYCYDSWEAKDAVYEVITDEDGSETHQLVEEAAEAGERYAIRYEEFNSFVNAGLNARLIEIEQYLQTLDQQ